MTVLELSFPAGRYHATPWGRHVNEGAVEWPPSPWRILRALIATWHLKARDEIAEPLMRSLVEKLSGPPSFRLPRVSTSHTRHYMPFNEGRNEKTTKVFDTFVQLSPKDALLIAWDTTLAPDQAGALRILADRLGYFGRAESLVVGRLLDGITSIEPNAAPFDEGSLLPPGAELIRLLTPMAPETYSTWRHDFVSKAEAALGPRPTAAQRRRLPQVPSDLFAALHADTGDLQSTGWNLPPGAREAAYCRREDGFISAPRPLPRRAATPSTIARFAVVSTVAPRITQAISIGDRVHDALCAWSDQGHGCASVFTGLDKDGKPLTDHQHAHIFCEANGACDRVTHITIWAPMGFDESACLALRRITKIWGHGGHDLRLILHAIGQPGDFPDCALFRESKIWRSLTPFVSTLHPKVYRDGRPKLDADGWQQGSAAHDLLRHLRRHPQGAPASIRLLGERERPLRFGRSHLRSLQFQTRRHDGDGRRGEGSGSAFEIIFASPVKGPLALGYGAHFGLGLFVPACP